MSAKIPSWGEKGRRLSTTVRYSQPSNLETGNVGYDVTVCGFNRVFELSYSDGAKFAISERGTHVWGTCGALDSEDLAAYVRGPLLGFLLRRRGITAAHASAVSIAGRAAVLCGPSEAGKSTLAAALALRGVPILSDDIAAFYDRDEGLFVEPGYPRICLWPDAVENLFGGSDALPRLTPTWEKCFLPLAGERATFETKRKPLGVIYLLSARCNDSTAPRVEDLDGREALLMLVRNTYMNWLLDRPQRASEFDMLCRLVAEVPIRRVVPHSDPAQIGKLCELILRDSEQFMAEPKASELHLNP